MKTICYYALTLILTGILVVPSNATGKDFQGVIIYNITYENTDLDPQMLAMMPKTMKVKIKGDKMRTEMNMGMGSTVTIYNAADNTGITLMDMMGMKYAMKMTSDEFDEQLQEVPESEVLVTGEKKEIAGYMCDKAILKYKEDGKEGFIEHIVYYTSEIGTPSMNRHIPMFKDIQGMMLDYAMEDKDMKMRFSAISVDKKKINDTEFEIPEGYTEISSSEFKNMFERP